MAFSKRTEPSRTDSHQGRRSKEKITRIDRFHVEQYAYLVKRLSETMDGSGTLLQQCCAIMGSGISDGDKHNYADLQVLLAGGLTQQVGHLHYPGRRPLADLWLTLADRAEFVCLALPTVRGAS